MERQLKDLLKELVYFRSDRNTNYKSQVLNEATNHTVHPSNFIIHTGHSEYIPTAYLTNDMIDVDIKTKEVTNEFCIPLIYRTDHTRENDSINRVKRPNAAASSLELRSKSYESQYYFNNGLIMTDDEVLFCAAIKTEYVKETFIDIYSRFSDSKFFQLLIDNDLQNSDEAQQIMSQRTTQALRDLDMQKIKESLTVFINEDKLKRLCREKLIDYDNAFGRNSPWSDLRCIRDNIGDWFNSKVFVEPKFPSFQQLDGPEEYLMEKLHEDPEDYSDEDSGELSYASPTQSLNVSGNASYESGSWTTAQSGTTLNI